MDPCSFVRILIGNLALKFPVSSTKPPPCYCKFKLNGFPDQLAALPLTHQENSVAACFNLDKTQIDGILERNKSQSSKSLACLRIDVYRGSDGSSSCVGGGGKLLGRVSVPLDLRVAESRVSLIHNGWVGVGENKNKKGSSSSAQLYVTVRAEPDPRFVFQFGGEPECSPQVFQVQGGVKQAVFTCKFGFRNSSDRNLLSRPSLAEENTSVTCLTSFGAEKDQSSKERKGWSITIHDLSGSPVAMASMVTPFVPSPGSDRVSRSNPGAWLILLPGNSTWKPWGRLEAWREPGNSDALGYRFYLLHDISGAATTVVSSSVSSKRGGKFTLDTTTSLASTPANSPHSSCDFGSGPWSTPGSRPGSGSGSDFQFCTWPSFMYRGFVMSSTVEGVGKTSKPEVEIGVQHVTCTEDAAAYVALGAAMDLSMDACKLFSQKLRKELRQQSQLFVV